MNLGHSRILVAGGTGLGGRAVVKALLQADAGISVRVPHRSRSGAFIDNARVEYVQADLTRREDCLAMAKDCGTAVLAAAVTGGAMAAQEAPWLQVTDNAVVTTYMLEACIRAGVKRVILISTASAYQPFDGPVREDQMDWGTDPHPAHMGVGWVYRFAEKTARFWHEKAGIEIVILRLANIYGPYARFDPVTANFIPALIRKAVAADGPLKVWGSPDVVRDVLYVSDFAEAVLRALTRPMQWDVINIGSGLPVTVGQVATAVLQATGRDQNQVIYEAGRPATIDKRILDIRKAEQLLGWTPAIGIEQGIEQTIAWWRENAQTWKR